MHNVDTGLPTKDETSDCNFHRLRVSSHLYSLESFVGTLYMNKR